MCEHARVCDSVCVCVYSGGTRAPVRPPADRRGGAGIHLCSAGSQEAGTDTGFCSPPPGPAKSQKTDVDFEDESDLPRALSISKLY